VTAIGNAGFDTTSKWTDGLDAALGWKLSRDAEILPVGIGTEKT
jgi:hypothetical protein